MDETRIHDDPVAKAVFQYVCAAENVRSAYEAVEVVGGLTMDPQSPDCGALHGELAQGSLSKSNVASLRRLAQSLDVEIESETRRWFVHDECCTSGGWEEAETTQRGHALWVLQTALNALADRIGAVLRLKEAERLAASLRA